MALLRGTVRLHPLSEHRSPTGSATSPAGSRVFTMTPLLRLRSAGHHARTLTRLWRHRHDPAPWWAATTHCPTREALTREA